MVSQDGLKALENPASHWAEASLWITSRHCPYFSLELQYTELVSLYFHP